MRIKKTPDKCFQVGDVVRIKFTDHAEDGNELEFVVYGRVKKVSKKAYRINSWEYYSHPQRTDMNVKWFSIVRSAIDWDKSYVVGNIEPFLEKIAELEDIISGHEAQNPYKE